MAITSSGGTVSWLGLVLEAHLEHNYYDDSDFYALVWDPVACQPQEVQTGTTRFAGPYDRDEVDATPEVRAAYEDWKTVASALRRRAEQPSFRPFELPVAVEVRSRLASHPVEGRNVVGVLPGAEAAVVLTAHYDHLGIGRAEAGDSIYNGAVDNCTASAVLLALAQAWARTDSASRPTLVFVAADAEEEGLLGSTWQTRHPAVPLERVRGVVNFEMANPWGRTRDLKVIGAPRAAFARWLEPVLAARGMRLIGDLVPEQGFLFRSDQLAWLQAGVPAAWLDGGMDYEGRPADWGAARHGEYRARTYHHPGDEVAADFDYAGLAQLGEIAAELVRRMAAEPAGAWRDDPELAGMKR